MDVQRLELFVSRCRLSTLEYRCEMVVYTLGNESARPAWWFVCVQFLENEGCRSYRCRGLTAALTFIEQHDPDFFAWLLWRFPSDDHGMQG